MCLCAECTYGTIQDLWGKLLFRCNVVISSELTSGWQCSHSPRTAPRHAGAAAHPSVNRPSWTTRDHSDANPRLLRPLWTPQTSDRPLGQSSMRGSAKGSADSAPCAAPRDGANGWPQTAGPTAALPLEAGACTPDGPVSVVDERPRHDYTDCPRSPIWCRDRLKCPNNGPRAVLQIREECGEASRRESITSVASYGTL
jgi:hypothetical protein